MTQVPARVHGCRRIPRLIVAAAACFALSLAGCSDFFAQRDIESALEIWAGKSEVEHIDVIGEIAACARFAPEAVTANSPLSRALEEQESIGAAGYKFKRESVDEKHVAYLREDGRMHVRIAKPDQKDKSWFIFVSQQR